MTRHRNRRVKFPVITKKKQKEKKRLNTNVVHKRLTF